jgi:16S rRNA (cytidine1402-2'-O)-methyltransferase
MPGKLTIVGTPIGNLADFPPRAVDALRAASVILCEDTRHSRKLLQHFGIDRPLQAHHEHNEDEEAARYIERIERGETIALISDAGMPLVSDPGFPLVRLARQRGVVIEPIPGPFAGVVALVASGIAPLPFTFMGFTPHRQGERRDFYRRIADLGHTAIVYESPERVTGSLEDALEILGDVDVTVARELTKMHEELLHGTASEVLATLSARERIYGEITIVFAAGKREVAAITPEQLSTELERLRASGMRRNDAIKALAETHGLRKNELYKILVE